MSHEMLNLFIKATGQTLLMAGLSCAISIILAIPLGIILLITQSGHLLPRPQLNRALSLIVNAWRSAPFIVLLVAIIPFTRLIVGTSIGTLAAVVPLTLATIPFLARLFENAFENVSQGLIEAAQAMGASNLQIVYKILLPESLPMLVRNVTLTLVTLVGYSAMAGVVGAGGLGDVAIQYGYERFETNVMIITVILLIIMVQVMQMIGDRLASWLKRG